MTEPRSQQDTSEYACYGLRLSGLGVPMAQDAPVPQHWPSWSVGQRVFDAPDDQGMWITPEEARVGLPGLGEIRLNRDDRTISFETNTEWSPEALLHPCLAPAAAVVGYWLGRAGLHAAAVLVGDEVWALLAPRGGGKSTTAALLGERGCELFTDDLLVVEGRDCFAGPRIIDLREDAAEDLGGTALGRLGNRDRWRKRVEAHVLEAPLAGWVHLTWSTDGPSVREMPAAERIQLLSENNGYPISAEQLFDLAELPMLQFARPQDLASSDKSVETLLSAMA